MRRVVDEMRVLQSRQPGLYLNAARLRLGDGSVDPSRNARAVGVSEFGHTFCQAAPGQGAAGTDLDPTIPVRCEDFVDTIPLLLAME